MSYVTGSGDPGSGSVSERGIFIDALETADNPDSLVLTRREHAFSIMNLFPYNTGHMMVVPNRKVATLDELQPAEAGELMQLLTLTMRAGRTVLRCDGFNAGLNIGAVAGAGVSDHLHFHVVPRWLGDANFMPITAATMVIPELLPVTTARLKGEFATLSIADADETIHRTAGAVVFLPEERKFVLRRAADDSIVIPKGHIEAGESAADAAVREIHEETGYDATITGWCGIDEYVHEHEHFHVVAFFAVGRATRKAERHLDRDAILVDQEEALDMIAFDGLRRIVGRAIELVHRDFHRDGA